MQKKYNFIASIGESCACSIYLRKHKLQVKSHPFDWLVKSNLKTRFNMIFGNFDSFLNFDDLKNVSPSTIEFDQHDSYYYKNIKTGFMFIHDFKKGLTLEESYPAVKEKYERRIKRFYDDINSNEKVLLVYLSHNNSSITDSNLLDYSKKLNDIFNKQIDLLIFENNEEYDINEYKFINLNNNITKCLINSYPESREDDTLGNMKTYNKIFKQHLKLNESKLLLLKRSLFKFVINILSMFIINKQKKSNFKKKYKHT